jgi:hypothetical protein
MLKKIHPISISAFCSVMLISSLNSAKPKRFQAAAMAGTPEAIQLQEEKALSGLSHGGWSPLVAPSKTYVPNATAAPVLPQGAPSATEVGPLSHLADVDFQMGTSVNYSANICAALGVTQPGTPFPVKQRGVTTDDAVNHYFMVSRVRGRIDIIISHRTATEGDFYLTSVQGDLEQAVHAQQGVMPARVPLSDAVRADFEKDKALWLAQSDPQP